MSEHIYIARNPSFPDLIKIGYTERDPIERIKDLSRPSSVPTPYELVHACIVNDGRDVEKCIHFVFGDYRKTPDREFFTVNPEKVIALLRLLQKADITPSDNDYIEDKEGRESIDKDNTRRSNFSFRSVGISIGSTITYTRDENIEAEVVSDNRIKFRGKVTSLTAAAKKLLKRKTELRGPDFWIYENETLTDRRNRYEKGDFLESVNFEHSPNNGGKKPPLRFSKIEIPFGSTLVFSNDRRKKAKVINDRQISFDGSNTSLSGAAQKLLGRRSARCPDYWIYEGETLTERRKRFEKDG